MKQVLTDNRKLKAITADEADALFAEIAGIELQAVAIAADGDAEVQALKDKYEKLLDKAKLGLDKKVELLTSYITANPERFQKPRARKTPEGTYGLRNVSSIEIQDPEAVLEYAKENEMYELYEVTTKIKKDAVLKAINDGHKIPNVGVLSGERAFFKLNQELVAKAKGK